MPLKNPLVCCLALVVVLGSVSISNAQAKKNPFANNILGTLANPKMHRELELVEDQKESIKELMDEFGQIRREVGEDMKERWEAASDEARKELGKEYWSRVEEGRLEIVKQMKSNLLPHQIDRLEQLSAQRMMREGKGRESAGLLSDQMINYLEISEDQERPSRKFVGSSGFPENNAFLWSRTGSTFPGKMKFLELGPRKSEVWRPTRNCDGPQNKPNSFELARYFPL